MHREVKTIVTLTKHPRWHGEMVIEHTNTEPTCMIQLIDYDENCGAVGIFANEQEVMDHLEGFLDLALRAYDAKYAKYVHKYGMPTISLVDGKLVMTLNCDKEYYANSGDVVKIPGYDRHWVALYIRQDVVDQGKIDVTEPGLYLFGGMWHGNEFWNPASYGKVVSSSDEDMTVVGHVAGYDPEILKAMLD